MILRRLLQEGCRFGGGLGQHSRDEEGERRIEARERGRKE